MDTKTYHSRSHQPVFRASFFLFVFVCMVVSLGPVSPSHITTAYVDPTLAAVSADELSVIVTAVNAETAVSTVNAIGGNITSELWLIDAVGATITAQQLHALANQPGIRSVVANHAVKTTDGGNGDNDDGSASDQTSSRSLEEWNGTPDVIPTDDPMIYEFTSPVSIDVGADQLHGANLPGGTTVTGEGVTIAVIDSGVYFDKDVKSILGKSIKKPFLGQADFTDDGLCLNSGDDIAQHDGYCWTNYKTSNDRYGHGSHVAGTIWNQFTDLDTGVDIGIAPGAQILSVRVLGDDGTGSYADVIEGIQYAVENKDIFNVRVMNLSLSGYATVPYFVDPLDRAVEAAWAEGIVVLAAAGNTGPGAQTITVPGNDPYVITVGAIDSKRTPGYWADDVIPYWSATGPTLDGFVKPDVLAPGSNIVSFMYNDPLNINNSAYLVQLHPDYAETATLFRMSGTSMATAVTSGVVALMLEVHPNLTPDEVKFRLMYSARTAVSDEGEPIFSILQQGVGRIWAPDAVLGEFPAESANIGMNIQTDLAHGWLFLDENGNPVFDEAGNPLLNETELDFHYLGSVQRIISDDGVAYLYFIEDPDDSNLIEPLGIALVTDMVWLDGEAIDEANLTFSNGEMTWDNGYIQASGRYSWAGGRYSWAGGRYSWAGGRYSWAGGRYSWAGGRYSWAGGRYSWAGGTPWLNNIETQNAPLSSTSWVGD